MNEIQKWQHCTSLALNSLLASNRYGCVCYGGNYAAELRLVDRALLLADILMDVFEQSELDVANARGAT